MEKNSYLNLDLRSLNTFLMIVETGSITATADKLNVTQSAVSHGLEKLRDIFQDPLFLRAGRGIEPTPRARSLAKELKPLLASMKALTQSAEFNPAEADISLTIAANDFQRDYILPRFYHLIHKQVKRFTLNIIPSGIPAADLLRGGTVDLALSPMPPDAPDILQKRLFSTNSRCFYDANCRTAPKTREDFLDAQYISLTFTEGKELNSDMNSLVNEIEKSVAIRVSNFSGLASFLRGSELLTIAPLMMKDNILAGFDHVALPYESINWTMYMLWHQRYQQDPSHEWLRAQLHQVCADL